MGRGRPETVQATDRQQQRLKQGAFEIYKEFRLEPGDLVIYKKRASGFFGTPLVAHLTRLGIGSLIVCGESIGGCVGASVVDAYSYLSRPVLCISSASVRSQSVCLITLKNHLVYVVGGDG